MVGDFMNNDFRGMCKHVLPLIYDDSLSYYELLCKVYDALNKCIDLVNKIPELQTQITKLKNYVDNYFNSLDLQEEVNKKLDEMVSDGTLTRLLAEVITTPIDYRSFGAKLNGTADDSEAVKQAHETANKTGRPVEVNGGTLLLNFNVDVKTNTTLNCRLKITNETPNNVYNIVHDDYTAPSASINLNRATREYPSFNYGGIFCVPYYKSDDLLVGIRGTGSEGGYYYHQPLICDSLGNLVSSPFYLSNDHNHAYEYYGYSNIFESTVSFGGCTITTSSNTVGLPCVINVERNNTLVHDITFNVAPYASYSGEHLTTALITFHLSANSRLERFTAHNKSKDYEQNSAYLLAVDACYNIGIYNAYMVQGWGAIATYWTDTFTIRDSVVNRVDNHYGCFGNWVIDGVTFTDMMSGVNLGCGDGSVHIQNCKIGTTLKTDTLVRARGDLPDKFRGKVYVDGMEIPFSYGVLIGEYTGSSSINENVDTTLVAEYHFNRCNLSNGLGYNPTNEKCLLYATECYGDLYINGYFFASLINCSTSEDAPMKINVTDNITEDLAVRLTSCQVGRNIVCSPNSSYGVNLDLNSCRMKAYPITKPNRLRMWGCYVYGSGGNVNGANIARIGNCYAENAMTVGATTKTIQNCYNIT